MLLICACCAAVVVPAVAVVVVVTTVIIGAACVGSTVVDSVVAGVGCVGVVVSALGIVVTRPVVGAVRGKLVAEPIAACRRAAWFAESGSLAQLAGDA